jgi:hypothetical protein
MLACDAPRFPSNQEVVLGEDERDEHVRVLLGVPQLRHEARRAPLCSTTVKRVRHPVTLHASSVTQHSQRENDIEQSSTQVSGAGAKLRGVCVLVQADLDELGFERGGVLHAKRRLRILETFEGVSRNLQSRAAVNQSRAQKYPLKYAMPKRSWG